MRVAVVGLGTAGAAAARAIARAGIEVVGIDRGPLSAAGARWVNGVPRWTFASADLAPPQPPELRAPEGRFWLVAGHGPERVEIRSGLEVDMRHLTARLHDDARAAGASLRGEVRCTGFDGERLRTDAGEVDADVFVDATGAAGLRMLGQPRFERGDLCAAAQHVHRIADRDGAQRFMEAWDLADGEVVCFTGVAGGYSIVNVRVEGDEVSLLTGSLPAAGHPSGIALYDRFRTEHRWIGDPVFGGARAIPVRRAWEVIGRGKVALIGDAAGQVFPAHGSGIGMQLLAAKILAEALADGSGPWGYNVAWQRAYGGLLCGSDLFRRFSAALAVDDVRALMRRGVLSAAMMSDAMAQRPVRPSPVALVRAAAGLVAMPATAARLVPVLSRSAALEAHYARYPDDPGALAGWADRLARWSGVGAWTAPVTG